MSDWKENPQALVLAPVHTVVDRAMEVAGETTRVFPTTEIGIAQAPPEHPRPSPFTVGYWIDPGAPYALVLRVRRSGVGGSFVVRRGGALDALPVDRAGGCDGVKLAISERGIEVRARLAPPSPRDVDRTITADDGTCVAVPRTPAGHDLARLAAVLRALKPLLASCSGDSAAGASEAVTVVSALADTPWLDVASVLAVADDETNGTRLGFPSERPSLACEGALRVSDLPSAALPTVPSATVK